MLNDLKDKQNFKIKLKQLQIKHNLEEMLLFPVWKESYPKTKDELVKVLAEKQAKEIIELMKVLE